MSEKNGYNDKEMPPCGQGCRTQSCKQKIGVRPVCPAVDKYFGRVETEKKPGMSAGLVDLFEISDILIEKGMVTLRSASWSMFPVIMKGDILIVKPCKIEDINKGDVVLYKCFDSLIYAHRVIHKRTIHGETLIFTKADSQKKCSEKPIGNKELLGKLTSILRNGKSHDPAKKYYSLTEYIYNFMIACTILANKEDIRLGILSLINKFKQCIMFIDGLFLLLTPFRRRIGYSLRTHDSPHIAVNFSMDRNIKALDSKLVEGIAKSQHWSLAATIGKMRLGYVTMGLCPKGCPYEGCWIEHLFVRSIFRRMKIGTGIFENLQEILRQQKIKKIRISVLKKSIAANNFLKSLGFQCVGTLKSDRNILEKIVF